MPQNIIQWTKSDSKKFLENAQSYISKNRVTAIQLKQKTIWKTNEGSLLLGQKGDYLLSDGQSEWTVDAEVFKSTYKQLEDGSFIKTAVVTAKRLPYAVRILTIEGEAIGAVGSWLVRNPDGDVWPVSENEFQERYRPLTGTI